MKNTRLTLTSVAAVAALALGGSALAGAATSGKQSGTSSTAAPAGTPPAGARPSGPPPDGGRPGGRHSLNGKTEQALTGDIAAKVKAAALAKYPGATIERVETDVDHGSPYEAHVRTSDGKELEVLVNSNFEVTASNAMPGPGAAPAAAPGA